MKVLFAASECAPFIKTGGLGDVAGELPRALAALGAEVHVFLPRYSCLAEAEDMRRGPLVGPVVSVALGWRQQRARIGRLTRDGVTYHFVDNDFYFGRPYIYGSGYEDGERFAFFDKAVLESLPALGLEPDVIHCNDWQTGMIPTLARLKYPALKHVGLVYTIHNLKFQGLFPFPDVDDYLSLGEERFASGEFEFYGLCSFMKAGILYADRITTVSPSYAREIQTEYYGERMDGLLRDRSGALTGIVNGVGGSGPESEPEIAANYSAADLSGKAVCKAALQRELGLEENAGAPLIGMVTRLTEQKGMPLIQRVIEELMGTGVQLAVLGSGDREYTDFLEWASWRFPGRVAARHGLDSALAKRIYAGADMYLMPSRFEPCGISQLIALRFGAVPLVRETGGLRDTVEPYNKYTNVGDGFSFANYNAHEMLGCVETACRLYRDDPAAWRALVARAMQADHSWNASAERYMEIYNSFSGTR